jgi:hypothetical protein
LAIALLIKTLEYKILQATSPLGGRSVVEEPATSELKGNIGSLLDHRYAFNDYGRLCPHLFDPYKTEIR